jgi:hypothetical protein
MARPLRQRDAGDRKWVVEVHFPKCLPGACLANDGRMGSN